MKYSCGHCGKEKPTELGLCTSCGRFPTELRPSTPRELEPEFTLYWRGGYREVIQGDCIADALKIKKYDAVVLKGLDFYTDGDNKEYAWSYNANRWNRKTS